MPEHRDLTGASLHEPKGVEDASADTVYIADGSGSGVWQKPEAENVTVADPNSVLTGTDVETVLYELYQGSQGLTGVIDDVSSNQTILIAIPFDCTVEKIVMILGGTVTTADATVTVTRSDGAAMGTQTITASGSAEGTAFEFTPSGNNSLTYASHKYIKLVSDGGSTNTVPLYVTAHITRD